MAADSVPAGFEVLDVIAAVNLERGMMHASFGPMLQETDETAHSNEPILR